MSGAENEQSSPERRVPSEDLFTKEARSEHVPQAALPPAQFRVEHIDTGFTRVHETDQTASSTAKVSTTQNRALSHIAGFPPENNAASDNLRSQSHNQGDLGNTSSVLQNQEQSGVQLLESSALNDPGAIEQIMGPTRGSCKPRKSQLPVPTNAQAESERNEIPSKPALQPPVVLEPAEVIMKPQSSENAERRAQAISEMKHHGLQVSRSKIDISPQLASERPSFSSDMVVGVFGVTGYTGTLAVKFVYEMNSGRVDRGEEPIRFRLFGRNRKRLQQLVNELNEGRSSRLAEAWPSGAEICTITDLKDATALDAQTKNLSSVVSYAGPFSQCGEYLISSCVRSGCHYIDVTAELNWVKRMELKYSEAAKARKVKLVSCCGFDFLPTDLGLLQLEMLCEDNKVLKSWGGIGALKNVVHGFSQSTPMVSGGTALSAIWMVKNMGLFETIKWYVDPHGICNTRPRFSSCRFTSEQQWPQPQDSVAPAPTQSGFVETVTAKTKQWLVEFSDLDCFLMPRRLAHVADRTRAALRKKQDDLQESLLDTASMPTWSTSLMTGGGMFSNLLDWWQADYCVNFVMSLLMIKYVNWRMEVSNKVWGRREGFYYGGEIRRNYVWACFWSMMLWVGFGYVCLVSLLPLKYATYFVPKVGTGCTIDPETAFMYTHLRAEFPQGHVHLKWRQLRAETYTFAARSSIVAAAILARRKHEEPTEDTQASDETPRIASTERYGFLPPSLAIGPELLTEMAKRTQLEIAAPEIESYC